jgi:AraC family transcriptional activator of mtrCDE
VINEASAQRFGSDSVIERLCDSLFVLVIRYCIEENLVHEGELDPNDWTAIYPS